MQVTEGTASQATVNFGACSQKQWLRDPHEQPLGKRLCRCLLLPGPPFAGVSRGSAAGVGVSRAMPQGPRRLPAAPLAASPFLAADCFASGVTGWGGNVPGMAPWLLSGELEAIFNPPFPPSSSCSPGTRGHRSRHSPVLLPAGKRRAAHAGFPPHAPALGAQTQLVQCTNTLSLTNLPPRHCSVRVLPRVQPLCAAGRDPSYPAAWRALVGCTQAPAAAGMLPSRQGLKPGYSE